MQAFLEWLKGHTWAAFLLHQALLFVLAFGILTSVRRLTGRSIHSGQDPIGLTDGVALGLLSIVVIFLTNWFYRLLRGPDAPSLGLAFSLRRFFDLAGGFVIGLLFFSASLWISLWRGTASVTTTIGSHFDTGSIIVVLSVAVLMLLLQAAMEETTSRAFPMRIWEHRSLAFRLLVPAVFFVSIHLISETFNIERVVVLLIASIVHGLAYALTGNIWLTTGLHWGANVAGFSMSGLWHAGAVANVAGPPAFPVWGAGLVMMFVLAALYAVKARAT